MFYPLSIYLFYPVLFSGIFFLSGFAISQFTLIQKLKLHINAVFILVLSTFFFAFLALFGFLLPQTLAGNFFWIGFILILVISLINIQVLKDFFQKNLVIILIYLITAFFLSTVMYIRDHPKNSPLPQSQSKSYEIDFLIPYHSALNYIKGGEALKEKVGTIYQVTDRTPLMSLILIPFLQTFGQNIFVYQMFVVMTSTLLVVVFYELSRLFTNNTNSSLITLVISFSHFFIFTTLYAPTKTVGLFFILTTSYYIFTKRYKLSGIAMALAYLLHPYALVYLLAFSLYLAFKTIKYDKKALIIFILPTVLSVIIWNFFSSTVNKGNNAVYWSIMFGKNWQEASTNINKHQVFSLSFLKILGEKQYWADKYNNLVGLFNFYDPRIYLSTGELRLFNYFKTTLPGSLGTIISTLLLVQIPIIFRMVIRGSRKEYLHLSVFFIVIPLFIILMYQGFYLRMGLMWYALGVIPFLLIIFTQLYNEYLIKSVVFFAIIESLYLYFVYDPGEYVRLTKVFGASTIVSWFVVIFFIILFLYLLFLKLIVNENHRTSAKYPS